MSKIFLTSDLHINHANILKYEPESRPFETIEEKFTFFVKLSKISLIFFAFYGMLI